MSNIKEVGKRKIKSIVLSRLIVLIVIIIIPILTFYIFTQNNFFQMNLIPENFRNFVIIISPWLFTFSWLFILILFANRFAKSIDTMDEQIKVIPTRYKLFYGLNAILLLATYAFPLLTPLMCVLAFASLGYRLGIINVDWDNVEKIPAIAIILAIIFAIIPTGISIAVIPDLLSFSKYVWDNYWIPIIPILYRISLALSTSLTYGSFIIFYRTGVAEYENINITYNSKKNINTNDIKLFQIFFFIFLIFLEWKQIEIKTLLYAGGFIIIIFISFVNFIKGRKNMDFKRYTFGYILTVILYGANIISWDALGIDWSVELLVIMISASTYIIIFFVVFLKIKEE